MLFTPQNSGAATDHDLYEPPDDRYYSECPWCRGVLVHRNGKYGGFYGCSRFPECKFTCSEEEYVPPEKPAEDAWALSYVLVDWPAAPKPHVRLFRTMDAAKEAMSADIESCAAAYGYRKGDIKLSDDGLSADVDDDRMSWAISKCKLQRT